eukprot:13712721-Alexandrium_andersonii.AAC.1
MCIRDRFQSASTKLSITLTPMPVEDAAVSRVAACDTMGPSESQSTTSCSVTAMALGDSRSR